MALFDYQCSICGHVQEESHKISETPTVYCEKCNGEMAKKISPASFKLAGGGWYSPGYSGKNKAFQ